MEIRSRSIIKITSWLLVFSFVVTVFTTNLLSSKRTLAYQLGLPEPTQTLTVTGDYNPLVLRGLKIHPEDPFKLDFIIDKADSNLSDVKFKEQSSKLISYFLAAVTIPAENLWVNLSPYERDRIIPSELSKTDMGKDMLAQDYILKQLSSSLTDPKTSIGQAYWNLENVESGIENRTDFNKIWIIPESAEIFEQDDKALLGDSRLKIMSENDYLAIDKNKASIDEIEVSSLGKELLEAVSKEVNSGRHFVQLRQIYNSLILAQWFKEKVRNSIYQAVYIDKEQTDGVNHDDFNMKNNIFKLYRESFEKGVYDTVLSSKVNNSKNDLVQKRYFSGGVSGENIVEIVSSSMRPLNKFADVRHKYGSLTNAQVKVSPNYFDKKVNSSSIKNDYSKISNAQEIVAYALGKHDLSKYTIPDFFLDRVDNAMKDKLFCEMLIKLDNKLMGSMKKYDRLSIYLRLALERRDGLSEKDYKLRYKEMNDLFRDKYVAELIAKVNSTDSPENVPFLRVASLKRFQELPEQKKKAYFEHINNSDFPIYDETIFTNRFFDLYGEVADKDVSAFLNQAGLMVMFYAYKQHPTQRKLIPKEVKDLFDLIAVINRDGVVDKFKQQFLENKKEVLASFEGNYDQWHSEKYQIEGIDNVLFTLDELFSFINSDNFSIFKTFDYKSFAASKYKFMRKYHGIPLVISHGSPKFSEIIDEGYLGFKDVGTKMSKRNSKYVFFGTPYKHFSRNPEGMSYGNVFFEFPLRALSKESRDLINTRGNFFSSYVSAERTDSEGDPIPEDIVQGYGDVVTIDKASKIVYSTEKEKSDIQKQLNKNNFNVTIKSIDNIADINREVYEQSKRIVEEYIANNKNLFLQLQDLNAEFQAYLQEQIIKTFGLEEATSLLKDYIREASVMSFEDISLAIDKDSALSSSIGEMDKFYEDIRELTGLVDELDSIDVGSVRIAEIKDIFENLEGKRFSAIKQLVNFLIEQKQNPEKGLDAYVEFIQIINTFYNNQILTKENKLHLKQRNQAGIEYLYNFLYERILLKKEVISEPAYERSILNYVSKEKREMISEAVKKDLKLSIFSKDSKLHLWQFKEIAAVTQPYIAILINDYGLPMRVCIKPTLERSGLGKMRHSVTAKTGNGLLKAIGGSYVWVDEGEKYVYIREIVGEDIIDFLITAHTLDDDLRKKFFYSFGVAMAEANILGIEDRGRNLSVNRRKLQQMRMDQLLDPPFRAVINIDRESALNRNDLEKNTEDDYGELVDNFLGLMEYRSASFKDHIDTYLQGFHDGYKYHRDVFNSNRPEVTGTIRALAGNDLSEHVLRRLQITDQTLDKLIRNARREINKGPQGNYWVSSTLGRVDRSVEEGIGGIDFDVSNLGIDIKSSSAIKFEINDPSISFENFSGFSFEIVEFDSIAEDEEVFNF